MEKKFPIGKPFKIEPYDAPHLVLTEDKMNELYSYAMNDLYHKNIEAALRVGLFEFEETNEILTKEENFKYANILFAKKVFENLEHQKQYQKINIVFENPQAQFSEVVEGIADSLKIAKEIHTEYKRIERKGEGELLVDTRNMYFRFLDLIASRPIFNEIYLREKMDPRVGRNETGYLDPYQMSLTGAIIQEYDRNPNYEYWAKQMDISYLRYEIDFSEEFRIKLFVGFSKIYTVKEKDFRPWDSDGEEVLYDEMNSSEIKNQMLNKGFYRTPKEKTALEKQLDLYEETKKEEEFDKAEEIAGACPIKQMSYIRANLTLDYHTSAVVAIIAYLLKYNIIEKKVEKTRVLKTNKNKKKKGGNNYKSIVKTYYTYNEEKQTEIIKENSENYKLYKEKLKETEKEEIEKRETSEWFFEKDEWEVKPHTRRLKNGKVIQVSGQKRRRNKELLKKENSRNLYKTMGITEGEIEKVRKNSENK